MVVRGHEHVRLGSVFQVNKFTTSCKCFICETSFKETTAIGADGTGAPVSWLLKMQSLEELEKSA
jgi:hypothetical protein